MEQFYSRARAAVAAALVAGFFVTAVVLVRDALTPTPSSHSRPGGQATGGRGVPDRPGRLLRPMFVSPRFLPPAVAAEDATLPGREPVIGVEVDGQARAYRVAALARPEDHVVNDLVAGRPVTMTYCGKSDCARAFTGAGPEPLDVLVGGYDGGLLLIVGGQWYRQETGETPGPGRPFPYESLDCERTTWGDWVDRHPCTDVVVDLGIADP